MALDRRSMAPVAGGNVKHLTVDRAADSIAGSGTSRFPESEKAMHFENEYRTLVRECADQGRALARKLAADGIIEPLYLYHRPSAPGRPGRFFLARDSAPIPPGVVLTTGEGLRGNVPFEAYFQWVHERGRRAPVLSVPADGEAPACA